MNTRSLRKKLDRMGDQLQILEMSEGVEHMMASQMYKDYQALKTIYDAGRRPVNDERVK